MLRFFFLPLALLVALVLGCSAPAPAQVSKFHLSLGTGLIPLRSTAPVQANPDGYAGIAPGYVLETINADLLLINANLGFDAPLYQFAGGEQALGISLNAGLGALYTSREDVDGFKSQLVLDYPQYATYRYGAKASKHSKKAFGLGLGLGYRFCSFMVPFNSPSALLEGVYSDADSDWFIRLSADMRARRFYNDYSSEGLVEVLRIREFLVQLGRSF